MSWGLRDGTAGTDDRRRVYYDLGKNEDVVLEDGADKLTVHRVNLTE